MAQVTGIVKIKINGNLYRSKEDAKLKLGGKEREAVTGFKVYGYTEKVVPSEVDFTIAHTADLDPQSLNAMTSETLEFECDTGPVYIVRNAFCTKALELTGGSGDLAVAFSGDPVDPSA